MAQRLSKPARRAQLLDVAAKLFADSSYAGVTTAMLAKEAGVTEPVLYQHFADKEDLYHAVLREGCARTLAQWEELAAGAKDPLQGVFSIARQQVRMSSDLWTYYKVHLRAVAEASDDAVSAILRDNSMKYHGFLTSLFEKAQAAGLLRKNVKAADLAWLLFSQGQLLNFCRQIGLNEPEQSGYIDRLISLALMNLQTQPKA